MCGEEKTCKNCLHGDVCIVYQGVIGAIDEEWFTKTVFCPCTIAEHCRLYKPKT